MRMEAGLDTGPVLLDRATPIGATETTGDVHDRLARIGAELIVEALARIDRLPLVPQDEAAATYAAKVDKAEARIDWTRPAAEVDRKIRGLSPVPGAWCLAGGERMRLLRSEVAQGQGEPGARLDGLTVACGHGSVRILEAQRPGRRPMPADEILRGADLPPQLG